MPSSFCVYLLLFFYKQVQKRYDSIDRLWNELPTREEPCVTESKAEVDEIDGKFKPPNSPKIESEEHVCMFLSGM